MIASMEFLLFLALIPGVLILFVIYTSDRIDREPLGLILKLVLFGALSTLSAVLLESLITKLIVEPLAFNQLLYALSNGFLCAALSEELVKLFFLKHGTWRHREFNFHYDAVVYAVSVSLGFAMLENVLYVFQNGIATGIIRAVCSVPLHAFCGVFMGYHYGNAKNAEITGNGLKRRTALWNAWFIPFLIHGTFDALLMYGSGLSILLFLVFLTWLYVVSIRKIKFCIANDQNFLTGTKYAPLTDWRFPVTTPVRRTGKANFSSVVGLLLGIVSYLTLTVFLIPNVLSIVFSCVGLRKQKSKIGVAGLILGTSSLLFGILIWMFI